MVGLERLPSFGLEGRVAVVVGGTGTLGQVMAATLAGAGAATVVVGRDRDRSTEVADLLAASGAVHGEACDATSRVALADLVGRVVARLGRIDVLVNAAGANAATPFLEIDDGELDRLVAVDQLAVVRSCQEFGRYFVDRARAEGVGASVVNVGSVSARRPLSRVFTYAMAKAAVHNLTANLAREWGPLGIRANVLVPGFVPAAQNRAVLTPERVEAVIAHTPLGRFGEPGDLAGALLLLASDAGRFITGTELVVDGGFSAVSI